jgi:hypothetical protein
MLEEFFILHNCTFITELLVAYADIHNCKQYQFLISTYHLHVNNEDLRHHAAILNHFTLFAPSSNIIIIIIIMIIMTMIIINNANCVYNNDD